MGMRMKEKRRSKVKPVYAGSVRREIGLYTLGWGIGALFLILSFVITKRSFLWYPDGIYQHYTAFCKLCSTLGEIVSEHSWPASYDFTIGQGADLLMTLNSYDLTDPVSVFAAAFVFLSKPVRYTFMIFLKLYLTGFSLILFCKATEKVKPTLTAAAAVAYAFSNAILYTGLQHPNFINWGYFLPLLLCGVEWYRRKDKKLPLVLFVFFNVITNYYTFYINSVLVVLYVIITVIDDTVGADRRGEAFRTSILRAFKTAGIYASGILLSALTLFPTAYVYLNNPRVAESNGYAGSLWHYAPIFYVWATENIFSAAESTNDTMLGLNAVLIIALFALYFRKGNRKWKVLLAILALMMGIPFFGRLLNGFSYASNRWAFSVPFFAAYALVLTGDSLPEWTGKDKMAFFMTVCTYCTGCLLHSRNNLQPSKYTALIMISYVTLITGLAMHYHFARMRRLIFALAVAGALYMVYYSYSDAGRGQLSTFVLTEEIAQSFEDTSVSQAAGIGEGFFRVEKEETMTNIEGYHGVNGTSVWYSMLPSYYLEYYIDLALNDATQNCNFRGLDGRTSLLTLAGVRYYTKTVHPKTGAPYGFTRSEAYSGEKFEVLENEYALPIGYTYTGYIPKETYKELDGIAKEQAMLSGAVLEEVPEDLPMAGFGLAEEPVEWEFVKAENAEVGKNEFLAQEAEGTIQYTAEIPEDCELYLYIKKPELTDEASSMTFMIRRDAKNYVTAKRGVLTGSSYKWTFDLEDLCMNLGYGHEGKNTFTFTFLDKGAFSFEEIGLIAVPMDLYRDAAGKLSECVLENVTVEKDFVSGTINAPEKRILQFAIPYSVGWSALVDGEEAQLVRSDTMYMALILPEGEHTVELRYRTPYAKEGLIVSLLTACCMAAYAAAKILIRRKKTAPKG